MTDEQKAAYGRVACLGALTALSQSALVPVDSGTARSLLAAALLMTTSVVPAAQRTRRVFARY